LKIVASNAISKDRVRGVTTVQKDRIASALSSASDTKDFIIGAGCIENTPALFKKHFKEAKAVIVADENTFKAAGDRVNRILGDSGLEMLDPYIFPGKPVLLPDYRHIEKLKSFFTRTGSVPVCVGSGTINDIVKRASYESGCKYIVAATAASVDGYSSFGAAVLMDGYKKNLECTAPLAIVADIDILQEAPKEMTAAGYADLASKIIGGADWIVADTLALAPIDLRAWSMTQDDLRKWIGSPGKLASGDTRAFENLFEGLTMSGFAMQAMKSSRPASGCEHFFSHIWEMQHLELNGAPISHGFKVGLGILAATAFMETVFEMDVDRSDLETACKRLVNAGQREREVRDAFAGTPIVDQVVSTSLSKHLTEESLKNRLRKAMQHWPEMQSKVKRQLIPFNEIKDMLDTAGCPTSPGQINLTRERLKGTFFMAQMIRSRYTVLDLAYELGWLKDCVNRIFSSGKYF
jgi:glycerol-1-phosphate dehydrogenase [NAD(P)+]